jgi:hypothetical protein
MPLDRQQLMLEEYKLSYGFGVSFSTMRGQVFAACVTAVGLIAAFAKSNSFPIAIGTSLCLVAVSLLATSMLAALNRGCVVFLLHSARMERTLGIIGFSSCFPNYLKIYPKDSGSYAFMLGAWLLTFAANSFAVCLLFAAERKSPHEFVLICILSFGYVAIAVWNGWRLWKYHHPINYAEIIRTRLEESAQVVTSERIADQSHALEPSVGPDSNGTPSPATQ